MSSNLPVTTDVRWSHAVPHCWFDLVLLSWSRHVTVRLLLQLVYRMRLANTVFAKAVKIDFEEVWNKPRLLNLNYR